MMATTTACRLGCRRMRCRLPVGQTAQCGPFARTDAANSQHSIGQPGSLAEAPKMADFLAQVGLQLRGLGGVLHDQGSDRYASL